MSKHSIEQAEHPLDFCRPDYSSRPVKPLVTSLIFDPAEGTLSIDFRRDIAQEVLRALIHDDVRDLLDLLP